jgi:hypothetical protein
MSSRVYAGTKIRGWREQFELTDQNTARRGYAETG